MSDKTEAERDFLATWPASANFAQVHDDGREQVGSIFLPSYKVLEKHALSIVRGSLLASRIGGWDKIWEPEEEPLWKAVDLRPGSLRLEQSYSKHVSGKDNMAFMQWSVSWRIAADGDSHGWSAWYMTPSMALAQMIALVEENERELRDGMLEHVGGLS